MNRRKHLQILHEYLNDNLFFSGLYLAEEDEKVQIWRQLDRQLNEELLQQLKVHLRTQTVKDLK